MNLKLPHYRKKGMWQMTKFGKKFIPACTQPKRCKFYCRPITRKFILWEAKEML